MRAQLISASGQVFELGQWDSFYTPGKGDCNSLRRSSWAASTAAITGGNNVEIRGCIFPQTNLTNTVDVDQHLTHEQRTRRINRLTADKCNGTRLPPPESRGLPRPTEDTDSAWVIS